MLSTYVRKTPPHVDKRRDCTCVNVVGGVSPVGQEARKADRETGNLIQTNNL